MSKPKKNLMPLLSNLDQRTDNYFAYDKDEQCYVLAQTWHIRVHITGTPADKYELVYFRAARRFNTEPAEDDIKAFAAESERGMTDHMNAGIWTSQLTESEEPTGPFTFDKWAVKDIREGK